MGGSSTSATTSCLRASTLSPKYSRKIGGKRQKLYGPQPPKARMGSRGTTFYTFHHGSWRTSSACSTPSRRAPQTGQHNSSKEQSWRRPRRRNHCKSYRIWSSLRAKACLKYLAHQCDFNMYGFFPGREASQYWYEQQAWVELSLQGQSSLGGWCSDIQKCFNALPRLPLLQLALHLGIPAGIVRAWANFLNHSSRRFQIRGGLGNAILATTGLPEGCALSTVAMCILDMSYHLYFKAFLPKVQTYSYVDNRGRTASCMDRLPGLLRHVAN